MGCCASRQLPDNERQPDGVGSSALAGIRAGRRSKRSRTLISPPSASQIQPPIPAGRLTRRGISRAYLERERDAFFDTRIQGEQATWAVIREVCRFLRQSPRSADDMEEARKRLSDAGLTCPSGQMWDENRDIGDRERNRIARRQRRFRREGGGGTTENPLGLHPTISLSANDAESSQPTPAAAIATNTFDSTTLVQHAMLANELDVRMRGKHIPGLWDNRGNHYYVPLWCMADPASIVEDDQVSLTETVERDAAGEKSGGAGGAAAVSAGHHAAVSSESINEKKSPQDEPTELSIDNEPADEKEKLVELKVRLSDRPRDVVLSVNPNRPTSFVISSLRKEANIASSANVRLIHAGQVLSRTVTLADQRWAPGGLIQAFVTSA